MNQNKLVLSLLFTILFLSMFLLGDSITGKFAYISQSMHCDGEECFVICKINEDCLGGNICCQKNDFGVCTEECETEYQDNIRSTSQNKDISSFIITTLLIIIGIIYFYSKRER
mgnify:FL=1|jgi:hypothetical protein